MAEPDRRNVVSVRIQQRVWIRRAASGKDHLTLRDLMAFAELCLANDVGMDQEIRIDRDIGGGFGDRGIEVSYYRDVIDGQSQASSSEGSS